MNKNQIFLRELTHTDVNENYISWFRNNDVTSFLEVDGKTLTTKMVTDYIDLGIKSEDYYMYAICLKEENKHIGNLKVGPINKKHKIADLVCVIGDHKYWGKGIATQAISIGNELAFEKHDIRKLHGQIYEDNIGSIKAYCKAGWIIEGVIKDRYIVGGKVMDQILVSCHNPKYFFPSNQTQYNVEKLIEMIDFRKEIIK
ncbi:MAG: GNAT family protein [Bacteroidia bacterium]